MDDRVDVLALFERILVAHQRDEPTTLTWPKSLRVLVVDQHLVASQRRRARKPDQLERVEAQIDATREHHVGIPRHQRRAGIGDRQQGRGASAIDRVPAAVEIEMVTDASGDRVRQPAG